MSLPQVLERITAALDQAGIAYMLTGSFASAYYGVPRSTQDIDLVVAGTAPQLRQFVDSLPVSKYYADPEAAMEAHQRESMFNVIDLESGWKIDMIIRKTRAFSQEEFNRRQAVNVQRTQLFVASAEDVIIAKLEWAKRAQSQRQIEDAAGIVKLQGDSLDHAYLEKSIHELDLLEQWNAARRIAENKQE